MLSKVFHPLVSFVHFILNYMYLCVRSGGGDMSLGPSGGQKRASDLLRLGSHAAVRAPM